MKIYLAAFCLLFGVLFAEQAGACIEEEVVLCWIGDKTAEVLREKTDSFKEPGKKKFGDGFDLRNYLRYNHSAHNFVGRADVVVPARKWNLRRDKPTEAFFWQAGTDRYERRDKIRDTFRVGGVLRVISSPEKHNGIFGVWGFLQQDVSAMHSRLAFGMDYNGEFGRASAQYYAPLTDWKQVGEYRERGQSSGDMSMQLRFSRWVSLRGRLSYWENRSKANEYRVRGSTELSYFMRPWLEFQSKYSINSGNSKGKYKVSGYIHVPLDPLNTWRKRTRDYTRYLYRTPRLKGRLDVVEMKT